MTVYISFGMIVIVSMFFVIKVLHQERKWMNYQFAGILTCISIGCILNMVYEQITDKLTLEILYKFTIYSFAYSLIFFLTFCISFINSMKGTEVISRNKQAIILFVQALILAYTFFIPDGIIITDIPNRPPDWSLFYYLYIILAVTAAIIPAYYIAFIMIYKNFEDDILKNKWKIFMIGMTMLIIEAYAVFTNNTFYNPLISLIILIISFFLSVLGAYLIYYGIGKEFKP